MVLQDALWRPFRRSHTGLAKAPIWLAPEPRHALVTRARAALHAALPAYNEQLWFPTGFTPHLSVGQTASPRGGQHLLETLQATWQPLQFTLMALPFISREADRPFQIAHTIPLGAGAPFLPEEEETGRKVALALGYAS